nr:serine hydrolase [Nocardia brasiliensis]
MSEIVRPAQLLRPDFGESVPSGRPVPTLSEYYRGALRTSAEPGTRWIYTDHGFATVGQIVEDVSGMPLAQYLREHIFRPLGMAETDLEPSRIDRGRQATGYIFGSPHEPAIWSRICGSYHMRGALTDARARMMVGAGAEVRIRSGRPLLRIRTPIPALLRGLPLHPDDDKDAYAFRIDLSGFGIPSARVVFGTDAYTGSRTLHVDLLPMTLYKRG